MLISFVIPAYRASATIGASLSSVLGSEIPGDWRLEIIVIDDGSPDGSELEAVVATFSGVRLSKLPANQGKCAAVNAGIAGSEGDYAIILDADDTLVPAWPAAFARVLDGWREDSALCFSACRDQFGRTTVSEPTYTGWLTFEDLLRERHSGEYLPIFRGDAVREAKGYRDPGTGWGCELLTYLGYAKRNRLWISAEVLRTYHVARPGSVTADLSDPARAREVRRCYDLVLDAFGEDYRKLAPRHYSRRRLRQAVFAAIAGDADAPALWRRGAGWAAPGESLGAAVVIALGGRGALTLARLAKRLGLLKKFG